MNAQLGFLCQPYWLYFLDVNLFFVISCSLDKPSFETTFFYDKVLFSVTFFHLSSDNWIDRRNKFPIPVCSDYFFFLLFFRLLRLVFLLFLLVFLLLLLHVFLLLLRPLLLPPPLSSLLLFFFSYVPLVTLGSRTVVRVQSAVSLETARSQAGPGGMSEVVVGSQLKAFAGPAA